jgi:hypothetical protein
VQAGREITLIVQSGAKMGGREDNNQNYQNRNGQSSGMGQQDGMGGRNGMGQNGTMGNRQQQQQTQEYNLTAGGMPVSREIDE